MSFKNNGKIDVLGMFPCEPEKIH